MTDTEAIEAVAAAAARAGGAELRQRYRADEYGGDYGDHDVKTDADIAAEERMLPVVRRAFPSHEVYAEETGTVEGAPTSGSSSDGHPGDDGRTHRWIIDPLDGTNNFTAGLPTFATSVAVTRGDDPLVAVVHQPVTDETYVARRGAGVRFEGRRVDAASDLALATSTVTLITGRRVAWDPDLAAAAGAIRDAVSGRAERVVRSWAPTVHSGLFARGRIQGLVQFVPDEEEQDVTELLAAEAGAATRRDGPLYVAAGDEPKLDGLWTAVKDADSQDMRL